jgi:hypothetical protein
VFVNQLVLVVSFWALACAGLRVAALVTGADRSHGSVLERVLIASTVAAGFVVCWTLALGLVGLAGSTAALVAGPVAAWAVTRAIVSVPYAPSLSEQLWVRWEGASPGQRALALALVGVAVGSVVEVARRPGFGIDALSYHIPDVVGWLHSGHAGAVQTFTYDYPVGYYPVTNEVLLTWVLGISRSFAPLAVFSTAMAGLALLALWRLLAVFRVPAIATGAALAAVAALPTFVLGINYNGPGSDLPALTWLACTAALSAGAVERPALLGPALLAAGLGIGTKTTAAPLAVAVLLAAAWAARSQLAGVWGWIAAGAAGAVLVGSPWYVRDTITHGWPLWPFSSGPTGDPVPHTLSLYEESFASRPAATLSADPSLYLRTVGGGLGLIVGTLATPLLARSRAALLAAALAVAALLAWATAPYTGVSHLAPLVPLVFTTIRYLLPALGACAVALGLAARDGSRLGRTVAIAVLAGSAIGSVIACGAFGYPYTPTLPALLIGAAAGAVVGLIVPRRPGLPARRAAIALPLLAGALAVVFLTWGAPGWLRREVLNGDANEPVLAFMLSQPGFASGSQPVAFAPTVLASLAGPTLRHPLSLIAAREPCPQVRARLAHGWIVVRPKAFVSGITSGFDASVCLHEERPVYDDGTTLVYGPVSS